MEELKTFLKPMTIKQRELFAKRCGTSYQTLKNIIYNNAACREALAINIERESWGMVRCESLRPDVDWAYLRNSKALAA